MSEDTRNVFARLADAQRSIGAVAKNNSTTGGGPKFNYRGIEDLMNALHPILAEHGLIIVPHVLEHSTERYEGYKNFNLISTVRVAYHVYGQDGTSLPEPVIGVGSGVDNSDKSYGKAMSYAYKMAIGQLFSVPTEEDNESGNRETVLRSEAASPPAFHNSNGVELASFVQNNLTDEEMHKLQQWFGSAITADNMATYDDKTLENVRRVAQKAIEVRTPVADLEAADR